MASTPSEILGDEHAVTVSKAHLIAMSRSLEGRCTTAGVGGTAIATLQTASNLTPLTAAVWSDLVRHGISPVLIGAGLEHRTLPGVRLAGLQDGDPLLLEWDVFMLTPGGAWGFVAVDLGDRGVPDLERRFRWTRTDDRAVVERCTNVLLTLVPSWTPAV